MERSLRLSNTVAYGYRVPEIERICNPAAKWAVRHRKKLIRIVYVSRVRPILRRPARREAPREPLDAIADEIDDGRRDQDVKSDLGVAAHARIRIIHAQAQALEQQPERQL